ncbi:cysteine hydrolase family protein [Xanthobacter sediminis]
MSGAKTLLQMAGVARPAPLLALSTVVVIDAQREYVDGHLPLDGVAAALAAIGRLLDAARGAGAPVIHVAHKGAEGSGGPFDPKGPGFAFAAPALPAQGEGVVEKTLPNAFAGTDLQARLAATGRKSVIFVGFMTHMCVSTTARAALDLGYVSYVAADAVATRALPDPLGGPDIPAPDIHRAALAELADRFATVVTTAEIA